jgi:hypothetical protein
MGEGERGREREFKARLAGRKGLRMERLGAEASSQERRRRGQCSRRMSSRYRCSSSLFQGLACRRARAACAVASRDGDTSAR